MKKLITTFSALVLTLTLTSCSIKETVPNQEAEQIVQTEQMNVPIEMPEWSPVYDDVFELIDINPSTYLPMSYDELMTNPPIEAYYEIQIIRVLTDDEAQQLKGWASNRGDDVCTFYEGQILSNLLTGEKSKDKLIFSCNGRTDRQDDSNPPYTVGDILATAIMKKDFDECEISRPYAPFMLQVDVKINCNTDNFTYEDGYAYKRCYEFDFGNYGGFIAEKISESVITSTTENPVLYTEKVDYDKSYRFTKRLDRKRHY